jgi:hypothetical protein
MTAALIAVDPRRQALTAELPAIAAYMHTIDSRIQPEHLYLDYDHVTDRHFVAIYHPSMDISEHRTLNARLWARFRTPQ